MDLGGVSVLPPTLLHEIFGAQIARNCKQDLMDAKRARGVKRVRKTLLIKAMGWIKQIDGAARDVDNCLGESIWRSATATTSTQHTSCARTKLGYG